MTDDPAPRDDRSAGDGATADRSARTWTPGELHEAINGLLEHVFGEVVWIEGELVDLKRSRAGHAYFRLLDADGDRPDSRPSLSVTLFDSARRSVNSYLHSQGDPIRMSDGIRVRVGGRLATYPARSTVQLVMDRIDPAFTLGLLGRERARILATLKEEGLIGRNRETPLPLVPLRVGLVTSIGSAAHADALDELSGSGIGFHVLTFDARTQGTDAPESIVRAIGTAPSSGVEVILLVRGGGAVTDLAAFDDETVARAIAACPVPVITGIGHELDSTVADAVAHTTHKTPTAAAASIVEAVRAAGRRFEDHWAAVRSGVEGRMVRADDRLARVGHRAGTAAAHRLERRRDAVDNAARAVATATRRRLRSLDDDLRSLAVRPAPAAVRVLGRAGDQLTVLAARSAANDPHAALRRGWSITRTVEGPLVRSVGDVDVGTELVTTTADGTIRSRVLDREGGSHDG